VFDRAFGNLVLGVLLSGTCAAAAAPTRADILRGEYGPYRANNDLLFYHLDVRVDPDKKFIGMPLDPGEFDDFARHYPDYSTILWHKRFSVQNDLLRYLTESGRYRIAETVRNDAGAVYLLLEPQGR